MVRLVPIIYSELLLQLGNIGAVIIVGLLALAMFLISNMIRSTIYLRRTEIEIMRLVGATKAYIRWPFFRRWMIGLLGSIIPIGLVWSIYHGFYKGGSDFFSGSSFSAYLILIHSYLCRQWLLSVSLSFLVLFFQ